MIIRCFARAIARMTKRDYYSEIAKGYDELYLEEQLSKLRVLGKVFRPQPLMLDLGCGTGIAMKFFGIKSVGVDPSFGMLEKAGGMRVCAMAEFLPFKDKSFGSIIALTSAHNFKDLDKSISEIKRVSKENCKHAFSVLKKSAMFVAVVRKLCGSFKLGRLKEDKDLILFEHAE